MCWRHQKAAGLHVKDDAALGPGLIAKRAVTSKANRAVGLCMCTGPFTNREHESCSPDIHPKAGCPYMTVAKFLGTSPLIRFFLG